MAILKQGVEVWNKWRDENAEIEPDPDDPEKADLDGVKMGDVAISPEKNRMFEKINGSWLYMNITLRASIFSLGPL